MLYVDIYTTAFRQVHQWECIYDVVSSSTEVLAAYCTALYLALPRLPLGNEVREGRARVDGVSIAARIAINVDVDNSIGLDCCFPVAW